MFNNEFYRLVANTMHPLLFLLEEGRNMGWKTIRLIPDFLRENFLRWPEEKSSRKPQ